MGSAHPCPLVRRASAEKQEARKRKEKESATLLATRIPVTPPLSISRPRRPLLGTRTRWLILEDSRGCLVLWAPAVSGRSSRCLWTSAPCCLMMHPTVASCVQNGDVHTLVSEWFSNFRLEIVTYILVSILKIFFEGKGLEMLVLLL